MKNAEEAEARRLVLAHLGHALQHASQLPDRDFVTYLIGMVQIEVERRLRDQAAEDRWAN
jgi:hypothetical protein